MNGEMVNSLRRQLRDREYSEGYAESFLNSFVATQIKVIREQRGMTQAALGECIGTTQAGVSRYENVNYSSWSIKTLIKLARAFQVRLKVSFEPFGTLPEEAARFDRKGLERVSRDQDPDLQEPKAKKIEIADELFARCLSHQRKSEYPPANSYYDRQRSNGADLTAQDVPGGAYAASGSN
jgi:transcriptional regulator with XRE-family HTH domain